MAWCRPGDKPLSEPMMVSLLTHIYASLGLNELITYIVARIIPVNVIWFHNMQDIIKYVCITRKSRRQQVFRAGRPSWNMVMLWIEAFCQSWTTFHSIYWLKRLNMFWLLIKKSVKYFLMWKNLARDYLFHDSFNMIWFMKNEFMTDYLDWKCDMTFIKHMCCDQPQINC